MRQIIKTLAIIATIVIYSCETKENKVTETYEDYEYTIYLGDKKAGFQKSSRDEDGTYRYSYEFNDRGRGPSLEEKVVVNNNGIIIHHKITGHNYLKDTVNEVFNVKDGIATWQSKAEKGEEKFDNESFFSAINASLGSTDLLLKKLLESESKEVKLLPGGSIKITGIEDYKINDTLDLKLVEFAGQSFTPTYNWIDKNNRFFAYTSSWFTCIKKGYDSIAKQLEPIQKKKENEYLKNLASSFTENPSKNIFIKNTNVFDSRTGKINENVSVLIEGNKIVKVTKESLSEDKDFLVINGNNKTLLPGLIDMHTHIDETDGLMHLAAGVTSVRDLGNSSDLPDLKENFDTNKLVGPRILVMSGFIDKAGPYAGPTGSIINNLEEGLEAIENYHKQGYKQIKLYSSIEPEWVKPLAEKAHELNLRVSGHIPAFMTAAQAVKDGYDEIQHANMLALNFLSDTIDTRTPLRFSMVAEHHHQLDFDSKEFKAFIELLQNEQIVIDPTVSIFDGMFTAKAGAADPSFAMILERLPLSVQRGFYSGGLPMPEGKEEIYKKSYDKLLALVKELYDHGITIVPGTDSLAGFGLHTELENYVEAGIPVEEVLKIATSGAAKVCAMQEELGFIEEGKLADLILIDGNPLENIKNIRNVELTIKNGNVYNPEKLYEAIGVKPYNLN